MSTHFNVYILKQLLNSLFPRINHLVIEYPNILAKASFFFFFSSSMNPYSDGNYSCRSKTII